MIQPFLSHGSVVIHAVHDIWVHVRCQRRKLNTDGPCTEGRFFMISCNISWYHDKNDSISRHTGSRYKVQQYHAVFMISCGTSVMISCKFSWYELWRHMTSHDVTLTSLSYHEQCRMISWKWHDMVPFFHDMKKWRHKKVKWRHFQWRSVTWRGYYWCFGKTRGVLLMLAVY